MQTASGYAPGRVELLGNHTDYNEGVVLAAAIDRGLTVKGTRRSDDVITFASSLSKKRVETRPKELSPSSDAPWANYALGVVQQFELAGHVIAGFDATVSGDVPVGAGLSSSAAFEVATAAFLMALHEIRLEPMAVAKLCQRAENAFVGVRSGLLDQVTSVFGRAGHAVYFDSRTEEIQTPPLPSGSVLVIAESGVERELGQSLYNQRREECAAAAKALEIASLRDATAELLLDTRGRLDPILRRRAAHIVGENERVNEALGALARGDAFTLGALMNASHESSRFNFENSTPDLDRLVTVARSLPGVFGARLTGGGFGGATVSLADRSFAIAIVQQLRAHSISASICHAADGAASQWPD